MTEGRVCMLIGESTNNPSVLIEFNAARFFKLFKGGSFGVISPKREWMNPSQVQSAMNKLKRELQRIQTELGTPAGFVELDGEYQYEDGTVDKEPSLLIPYIKREDLIRLAKKFDQESVIYSDRGNPKAFDQSGNITDWSSHWNNVSFHTSSDARSIFKKGAAKGKAFKFEAFTPKPSLTEFMAEGCQCDRKPTGWVSGVTPIKEESPPDPEIETWIKKNKDRFLDRYGDEYGNYLYGKAWNMYYKKHGGKS